MPKKLDHRSFERPFVPVRFFSLEEQQEEPTTPKAPLGGIRWTLGPRKPRARREPCPKHHLGS